MIAYNNIKSGVLIVLDRQPFEVLSAQTVKKQRQKPTNQTKLRNLITGSVIEKTFHQSDKVEEADIEKKSVRYLYTHRDTSWFANPRNPKERFSLPQELVKEKLPYLKENGEIEAFVFGGNTVGIGLPIKVDLVVTEAPLAVRGNTAQGATKQVKLETGLYVSVPLFISEGDVVRINTETGQYSERVEKK